MKYKNILQIDDDSEDCEFFEETLKTISDATYTCMQNPVEALHKLTNEEIKPDLIFLDINMPLMSGPELLTEIKKRKKLKDIPVFLLSTASFYTEKNEKLFGAKGYLIKPNTFSDFKKLLTGILELPMGYNLF